LACVVPVRVFVQHLFMGEPEMKSLWMDEGGAILSFELMLLLVLVVIGISVGMVVLRDAVVSEFQWIAAAVNSLNPSYVVDGLTYVDLAAGGIATGGTDATAATLGIGANTGQIVDTVVASAAVTIASDPGVLLPVTSP
jgi:hypothetical protein